MSEEELIRSTSELWPLEVLERLYDEAVCHGADATGGRDGGERDACWLRARFTAAGLVDGRARGGL